MRIDYLKATLDRFYLDVNLCSQFSSVKYKKEKVMLFDMLVNIPEIWFRIELNNKLIEKRIREIGYDIPYFPLKFALL